MTVGLTTVALIASLMQVLCDDWRVTLPKSIRAVGGSCLSVPCRFQIPASYDDDLLNCSHAGVWRKGSATGQIVFTSGQSEDKNIIQGEITGDLSRKYCTTVFNSFPEGYSDAYFFRLECPNRLKFTFVTGVYIDFQSDPPPPRLTSAGEVSEGDRVRLQCSVPVPCPALPPTLTWLPLEDRRVEVTQTQESQDALMSVTSTVTFSASASHHNQTVTCSVSYPLTQGGSTKPSAGTHRLSVQYAPRFTVATLSPSDPVSEGRAVTLTCSSDANPPVLRYTWYRDVRGQLTRRAEGDELVLLVGREDSGVYLCEAHNQRGSQRSRPVAVEVIFSTGSSECFVLVPYVISGVVAVLYVLTVVVDVYKYQSLSRRLKIELKRTQEHTYAELRGSVVASGYDQLQPKTTPPVEAPCYENPIAMGTMNQTSA